MPAAAEQPRRKWSFAQNRKSSPTLTFQISTRQKPMQNLIVWTNMTRNTRNLEIFDEQNVTHFTKAQKAHPYEPVSEIWLSDHRLCR
jgi:hypothetical protein